MLKKTLLIILILIFNISAENLIFHEHYLNLWDSNYEALPYERFYYKLLKEEPIKKNVNFLVAPWVYLIDKKQLDKVQGVKLNGGFALTAHFDYTKIIPVLKRMGINTLFAVHAYHDVYDGIKILSIPHLAINGVGPALKKDLLYSFVGLNNHSSREKIFKMEHPSDTVIIERKIWHYHLGAFNSSLEAKLLKEKEKNEYQDILARSRFSLSPRGAGHGSLRLWESLQAGAIPILIADGYRLPMGFDWSTCIVIVKEKDLGKLSEILANISPEKEIEMRNNCLKAFELYSGKNLVKVIRDYYET